MMTHDNYSLCFLLTASIMITTQLYRLNNGSKNCDAINEQHRQLYAVPDCSKSTKAKEFTPLIDGLIDNVGPHNFSQSLFEKTGNNMRCHKNNENRRNNCGIQLSLQRQQTVSLNIQDVQKNAYNSDNIYVNEYF